MGITLEMIDQVRQRTGVGFREAREALERCDGNVIEALCYIEEKYPPLTERIQVAGAEVRDKIADLLRQGNITKITIKKDGKIMMEIPVTLGALGALLLPELAVLGVILALAGDYTLEVERAASRFKPDAGTPVDPAESPGGKVN